MQTFLRLIFATLLVTAPFTFAAGDGDAPDETDKTDVVEDKAAVTEKQVITVTAELPAVPEKQTTFGKLALDLDKTPASVGVVDAPLFRNQQAYNLADTLKNIAGVNVQTGFGTLDYFLIRGFESVGNSLVLTDGVTEPETTLYPVYNLERVEVVRGPAAMFYGGNALSGAVNMVRKQPFYEDFFQADFSYGQDNNLRGHFDWNLGDPDSDIAFRVNGLYKDTDNFRDGREASQEAINPALTWRIDGRSTLKINAEWTTNELKPDSGIPIVNGQVAAVPRERSYQSPFDDSEQEFTRLRVEYNRDISDKISLRNKLYHTDFTWDTTGTIFNGVFPDQNNNTLLARTQFALDNDESRFGNQFELILADQWGSVAVEAMAGVEYASFDNDYSLDAFFLPVIDVFNPVEFASEPLFAIPGAAQAGDASFDILAPYLNARFTFNDYVSLFVGGRYDTIDFEDRLANIQTDYDEFSPMAGLMVSPTDTLNLYAHVGNTFAPPSTLVQDPNRQPEETDQVEVGIKKSFLSNRLQANLAVYDLNKENIAIPDANGITAQQGDQSSQGAELEIVANLENGWYHYFTFAHNESELDEFREQIILSLDPFQQLILDHSGNTPAFAPENIANLWSIKEFANGLSLSGGLRYISSQFIAEDNQFELDSTTTLDLAAAYGWQNWKVRLNLKNVTDEEYFTRGNDGVSVTPVAGFGAFTTFQLTF